MFPSFNNPYFNINKKCLQKENRIDMNPNKVEGTEVTNELYLQFQNEINIFINCINGHEKKNKEINYVETSHVMTGSEDEFIFYLRNIQDNQEKEKNRKEKQLHSNIINYSEYNKNYTTTQHIWNGGDIEKKQKKKKKNYSSNSMKKYNINKNNENIIFENMLNKNEEILNHKISEIIEFGKKRNDPNIYNRANKNIYTYLKNCNLKGYENGYMNISENYNDHNNINIYNCEEEDDIWNTFMFTRNDSKDSKMIIANFINRIKDSKQEQNNEDMMLKKYTHKKKKKNSYQSICNNYTEHLNFKNINMENEQKISFSNYNNQSNVFKEYEKIVKKNEEILILLYKIIYKLNIFDINKKFNKKIEDVVNIYIIKVNNIISTYKLLLQYDNIQRRKLLEYYFKKNEIMLLKNILKYIIQLMSEIKHQYSGIKKQIQKKIMEIQKVAS
ncbi:hypothetical protein PFAG_04104 [Plasmodium falciparum Santa Lucia]|uniref:Uncharacterized protein n=13 Tax=Plasmodium falciparum TaxID=5833 RepID=Q8I4Z6_PLAF7|nr:conserved Plasmodium protein, unknown function [Plasmodium falciparum 3D7]ETW17377.1 hypothetical protein PFFVO_03716 [Plasmodium falciparum Vietnam Oak-Knoll (FVO)]ETW32318.1 hypothetical protein PFFCH_00226 [Plasmodium falciparum FCH/4]ETW35194.1 hypothetical protein PFTANZ_04081 [Plasmodium falciparum Tanzania (2000708)]ETW41276.1 hypothetical protein PFNF135_04261 [Plasmodium falciparum NF135/5.C10]ETW47953.1 hypothetical protein PFMALIP_03988 [Plasmodium falciparum MaliPS096_E11]ETW55|eukprot:XP_001350821.1 conserved Plasmodium protein, unknown function [Plasmodium falciparum 3D7]